MKNPLQLPVYQDQHTRFAWHQKMGCIKPAKTVGLGNNRSCRETNAHPAKFLHDRFWYLLPGIFIFFIPKLSQIFGFDVAAENFFFQLIPDGHMQMVVKFIGFRSYSIFGYVVDANIKIVKPDSFSCEGKYFLRPVKMLPKTLLLPRLFFPKSRLRFMYTQWGCTTGGQSIFLCIQPL